jgi:hypothetical protein
VKDTAPRRLIAMLFGYPLIATAIAFDAVWAVLHRGWWPPAAYSLAVTAIAGAIAAWSEHILEVPPAVQVVATAANLVMANTAMITAAGEVSKHTRHPGVDTAVALVFNFATLTVTLLICQLGETMAVAFRTRHLPAAKLADHWPSSYNAATLPLSRVLQPTTRPELDQAWAAMIHQLTDLQDHEPKTRHLAEAVPGNQVHTDAAQPSRNP